MRIFITKYALPKTVLACALLLSNLSHGAEREITHSLFRAIDERLGYMEDVALFKAQNQVPVEDIERERVVLEDAKVFAGTAGLDAQSMEHFFVAQINVAKVIQYRYRAEALTLGLPERSVNLESDIRPALDRLGFEIVRLFAELLREGGVLNEGYREPFMNQLRSRHLVEADKAALFDAMRQVQLQHH